MKRTKAREFSLQVLYMLDALGTDSFAECRPEELLELHKQLYNPTKLELGADDAFWLQLVRKATQEIKQIDGLIESRSQHWKLHRMSRVDRSILRIAAAELLACNDIPASVTMDEAIELAKRYGTDDSAAFVNGILDSLWKSIAADYPKPAA